MSNDILLNHETVEYSSNDMVLNEVSELDEQGRIQARNRIESFQSSLQQEINSEVGIMDEINENGLKEHFINGAYIRQLLIPKNTMMVSRIWTKTRMWIIATGEVTFTTEMGTQRVKAPYTKIVPHGSKVALLTHEDTLWFAITGTNATDSEGVKDDVTADDYSECQYPWDLIEGGKS